MACMHNNRITLSREGTFILAFCIIDSHAFFYKNQTVAKHILNYSPKERLKRKFTSKQDWVRPTLISGIETSGHYYCLEENALELRQLFFQEGIIFKIALKDEFRIKSMSHKDLSINVLPDSWHAIEQWCGRLSVTYSGQGLPSISFHVLQTLLKQGNQRETISGQEKADILDAYNNKCAICGSRGKLELDHICRHSESFGGANELQPLCQACHLTKTMLESRNLDNTVFGSSFSKPAWDQYVTSDKLPPLVYKYRETDKECLIADVKKCRRRALEYNPYPIPVFSHLTTSGH